MVAGRTAIIHIDYPCIHRNADLGIIGGSCIQPFQLGQDLLVTELRRISFTGIYINIKTGVYQLDAVSGRLHGKRGYVGNLQRTGTNADIDKGCG